MSGRLISVPSLKLKKKKRPSRAQSQMAPLASYDEFQLSDVSDNEEVVQRSKSTPESAPFSRLKHYFSTDDSTSINSDSFNDRGRNSLPKESEIHDKVEEIPIYIDNNARNIKNEIKEDVSFEDVNVGRDDMGRIAEESEEYKEEHESKKSEENENVNKEEDIRNEFEEVKDKEQDQEMKNEDFQIPNYVHDENVSGEIEESEQSCYKIKEEDEHNDEQEEELSEDNVNMFLSDEDNENKVDGVEVEEDVEGVEEVVEVLDDDDINESIIRENYNESMVLEVATPSDYSGIATEPNTPIEYNQSIEEESERGEEIMENSYQKEEYYTYEEEPAVDAGDDPFSIDYQQSRHQDHNPTIDDKEPPQIVITEPSDTDLPSMDTSKATKPARPPEPSKAATAPKRPPPPSAPVKIEVVLKKIPPPPSSIKRRNKQCDDDLDLSKKTKFPFKSHFEKKPLVPNPKKAILNVLKGESKKERKRRKAEEEFEKILNSVDPEDAPICESTEEWKAYKEFQERITASVQKTQEKINCLIAEENEFSEEISEKDEGNKENKDWTNFGDFEFIKSEKFEDLESYMSAVNQCNLEQTDIWGCDEPIDSSQKPVDFDTDFDIAQSTFDQTFNKRIEDTEDEEEEEEEGEAEEDDEEEDDEEEEEDAEDEEEEKEEVRISQNLIEDLDPFSIFDTKESKVVEEETNIKYSDSFELQFQNDDQIKKDTEHKVDVGNTNTRRRPKPQRQETLSGNNPFRKASLAEENNIEDINLEDESPFMAALKAAGVIDAIELEESNTGFDPLTTIYPDSGDEKEVNIEDNVSSQSSDSKDETFHQFKNVIKIIDSSEVKESSENKNIISILPAPKIPSGVKGPRERKLPPESKPSKQVTNDAELDDMFSDLRVEDEKTFLDIDDEQKVIRFESPLSGKFVSEEVQWEAFPNQKKVEDDEEVVWGEENTFKAEFEPLPYEIITFEPYHPVNENLEWKLLIRQPEKKSKAKQISRYTSNRWWKDIYIRLGMEKDRPCLKFFENLEDSEPYRVVRIEPYMQLSRDKLQQYDKYGKLHIFKINHVVYKEMVGMRTEKFSLKTLQNLVSHKPKMNMVLDHMPLRTEIVKFGSLDKKPIRSLMNAIEDSMMSIKSHRDTSLEYTKEEVCCYVNDEYICELSEVGSIISQKARTRIQFAAFVTGNPYIILGINDKWRFGNEIVRRQDIIPIMHDDWITIYEPQFHSSINMEEYEKDHMIKFYPLDGCKFELMRFRIPLRPNKELPLTADLKVKINGARVDMRIDLAVPGFFSASKRHGAVHCDDIEIRIPIPEEWAYHFRVEKHTKYGSVHSALRKPGKIKGFERITQLAQSFLPASMLEASAGVAKYEHLFRAIVWRIPRLPEKNEASYKPHMMTCKFILAPHDTVPTLEEMSKTFHIEFTMSASTVSGATVRSISVEHTSTPERFVKYLATFKYLREIHYEMGAVKPPPVQSILDQPSIEEPHSSDESHPEKSSFSETGNSSPSRSQRNDSVDLLGANIYIEPNAVSPQPHSAMEDLLTLDCFSQPGTNPTSSIHNIMDDIAMVDDEDLSDVECS